MPNKKVNKGKAPIRERKLSLDEGKKLPKNKIITDDDSMEEDKKEEKGEKKYNYPKDDNSYDSISTDKTEEIKKDKKRKGKGYKSAKKNEKNKNRDKGKPRPITAIKENKKKFLENSDEDEDYEPKKNNKKRKKAKFKEDIEMKDETHKSQFISKNYFLPCREKEQEIIYDYIKKGLETNGNYSSLYIAGMPGTGKTACVINVINILEQELKNNKNAKLSFDKLILSGTEYPIMSNIYKAIYKFIFENNKRIRKRNYMQKLDNFFKKREYIENKKKLEQKNPMDSHIILVVDEIDFLINKTQSLLYNLFNWTTYDYSKLIVITISNTLDFPDHLLPKIKSRMGNNKLMFKPYNKEELMDIIKFKGIDYDKYSDDAIKLCCMKVSAINGDLRRTFQILLRAKELFSLENTRKSKYKKIDKNYIIQASEDLFNSKLRKVMESLQICEKIVICAILSKIKDENENKVKVGNIYDRLDLFFEKYNAANKFKIELYWEEFKTIIYNLIRLQIINFCDSQKFNFMENSITIKFYVEEFIIACDKDENLKPVLNYLTNFISA